MRRLTTAFVALTAALGLGLVAVTPAEAAVISPNAGVVAGTITLTESGGVDNSSILGVPHCGGNVNSKIELVNSSNVVVVTQSKSGAGANTINVVTQTLPNGNYTVRGTAGNGANSGFLGLGCTTQNVVTTRAVTISNQVDLSISASTATAAPQNTSVAVSATLADPNLAAQVLPGRTITFSISGGGSVNAVTGADGVATANLPLNGPPRTGATITASFAATAFYGAKSATRSIDITKNDSTTTVAQPATVVHGQATSFAVSVTAGNGTGTPTGTVQFKVDGNNFGAPVNLVGGAASSGSTSTLSTGTHAITAVYSGDGNFLTSTSAAKTQTVDKAESTTALTGAPSPTVSGQAVTFTATVGVTGAGAGSPTGAVQFNVDGQPFGTAVPLTGNQAQLTISNLSTGNHNVDATYNGDADFLSSSSANFMHGVNKAETNASLSTSDTSAVAGQPLTFSVDVAAEAPGSGTPTGTVQFAVDGTNLGGPVTLTGGQASSPIANLDAGSHNVTVSYSGDDNFAGTNDSLTQAVIAAHTTTTVTSSPNPSVFGQAVQVHAEVTPVAPATGSPEGAVQFYLDGNATGVFANLSGGEANATLTGLTTGSHTISAKYLSGDANFVTSTSAEIEQVVNKAATSVDLVSDNPISVFGQPVTFTATVSVNAPGAGSPSGTIVFKDGATVIGTQPVSSATGEQASITVSNLSVAQHAISATYSGDGDFEGSSGSTIQKVSRALTSTVVVSSANPAQNGQAISFTAMVTPVAPGAGNPTGTVTFKINGVTLGAPVAISGGTATSNQFSSLTPGTYTISAAYSGDGNFVASSGVVDQGTGQGIVKGATNLGVSSSPSSSTFGEAVTFTSTVTAVAPANGKPTGVVQIWEGDELLGATSLVPQTTANTSKATFVTSTLPSGSHAIRAVYVGNFNFTGSEGQTSQSVGQVPSVTGIASSKNPSTFGDSVTFTATVAAVPAGAETPTGSVTFTDGATVLGTATLSNVQGSQKASITTSALHAGSHAIKATYSGSTTVAGSASTVLTQQVNQAASHLEALVIYPAPGANAGLVRAKLTGNGGAPLAGQPIRFSTTQPTDGSVILICDTVTDANGNAECDATSELAAIVLDDGYDATFPGNADYLPSTDHNTLFNGHN